MNDIPGLVSEFRDAIGVGARRKVKPPGTIVL